MGHVSVTFSYSFCCLTTETVKYINENSFIENLAAPKYSMYFDQKTIIDTLHKEGKPQTFIAKEAGCSQSAVSKHVNRKLTGRKKCGRKRCTTNREPYEDCQEKSIQEFGWTSQGMDWGWGQGIKSHHTQTCQWIWLQLSSEVSYLG